MSASDIVFLAASIVAVGASALVVTRRNPIYSTLFMMAALAALAVIFVALEAAFLGAIQILLYAGAIMVLFVFVIMLLNPGTQELSLPRAPAWQRGSAFVMAAALLVVLASAFYRGDIKDAPAFSDPTLAVPAPPPRPVPTLEAAPGEPPPPPPAEFGTTERFADSMYRDHLVAFEAISLVILAAIAGVVVLAKRRLGDIPASARGGVGAGAGGSMVGAGSPPSEADLVAGGAPAEIAEAGLPRGARDVQLAAARLRYGHGGPSAASVGETHKS